MKRPARKIQADDPIPGDYGRITVGAVATGAVDRSIETFDVEQSALCPEARECSRDCEAGPCWFKLRLGIPTASNFAKIIAKSDERAGRATYMRRLAGEILTGVPAETYQNAAMLRGKEMEPDLRGEYAFTSPEELTAVGFVRRTLPRGRVVGCSPDSLVGKGGVLEIKTTIPELLIEMAETGRFPNAHRAQCVGSLWVTGREWCDLRVGYRGMPVTLKWRIHRAENEALIAEIAEQVEVFQWELGKLVERIRNMGGKR